jgi:hypothetical protein
VGPSAGPSGEREEQPLELRGIYGSGPIGVRQTSTQPARDDCEPGTVERARDTDPSACRRVTALETSEQEVYRRATSLCVGRVKGCLVTERFTVAEKRLQIPKGV